MARPLAPSTARTLQDRSATFGDHVVAAEIARLPGRTLTPSVVLRRLRRLLNEGDRVAYTAAWSIVFEEYVQSLAPNKARSVLIDRVDALMDAHSIEELAGRLTLHATRAGLGGPDLHNVCRELLQEVLRGEGASFISNPSWIQALNGLLIEYQGTSPSLTPPQPAAKSPSLHRYLVKFDENRRPLEAAEVDNNNERAPLVIRHFADGTTAVRLSAPSLMEAINEAQVEVDYARG